MKTLKQLAIYFLLWVISVVLAGFLSTVTFIIYNLYCMITLNGKALVKYYMVCAESGDQTGNAYCYPFLNLTFRKKGGYDYGDKDETVSSAMGKNARLKKQTKFAYIIGQILEWLDPNHLKKSIEENP